MNYRDYHTRAFSGMCALFALMGMLLSSLRDWGTVSFLIHLGGFFLQAYVFSRACERIARSEWGS